ncbi:MAG: flagellar motor switch protein FliG [Planctomycetota bacterium]|nr:flagellar motor switch protein FliG [Planctomycetota bacterium]
MGSLRKAAVLLTSLPEEEAAALLSKLPAKEVEAVSIEIARLTSVSGDEQETTINEFANTNPSVFSAGLAGLDLARSLVERAFGKNATGTLDNVRQSIEAVPFGFLKNVDSQNLLTFIIDEHPQTIALILCHLSPTQAADIVAGLPSERQLSVVRRIATMGQTNPEIINEVERGLESRIAGVMSQSFENSGGVESVAEILNVIDRSTERNLLENLAQENPDLVEEIRRLMFVFEDMNKFNNKDIQTVLKNVETSQWAMALKGASETLKQKIFTNLSQRAGETLREEIEYLGPVKLSAVEQVQQQIVDVIRRLQDSGDLVIHSGEEEEKLIS